MSVGFRKSLFGFNCDDVIRYIEKTHKTFSEKTNSLNEKADNLAKQLELSKEQYENLMEEKNVISAKLNEFTEKYEEIERLSENIGKLYLVAQANAQAIMANSENSAQISSEQVERNLSSIDEAHTSLGQLRENILKTSNDFVNEVESLISSLETTREKITENTAKTQVAKENFETVYESIVK